MYNEKLKAMMLKRSPQPICGIPCEIYFLPVRRAIRKVLRHIHSQFPDDFARLSACVRSIESASELIGGELRGQWKNYCFSKENRVFPEVGYILLFEAGLFLNPHGVIAHELGHACMRQQDWEAHQDTEYWADWYAKKWGFERKRMKRTGS